MSTGPLHDELEALDQQVQAARGRVREVQDKAAFAHTEAARVTEALIEACAEQDKSAEARLSKAKVTADSRSGEPWSERLAGAERAANREQATRDAWVATNIAALLAEVEPQATAAAAAISHLVDQLEQARLHWHAVGGRVEALVRAAGWDVRVVASGAAIDQAIRDARIALADPPRPLPANVPATVSIAAVDDPDPELREEARARIRAGR